MPCHVGTTNRTSLVISYVPKRDFALHIDGLHLKVKEGESIHCLMPVKLTESQVDIMALESGFDIGKVWRDTRK